LSLTRLTSNYLVMFMKNPHLLTSAQKEDLLIEWNIYSANQQETILAEFHKHHQEDYIQDDFLQFLRKKLEIDGYWKKVGIS
jgi:hypothetical protein